MKFGPFIASVFGILGFALSMLAGVSAGNPVATILSHAVMWAFVCYGVGYMVGVMAEQVSRENATRFAAKVAEADKLAEQQRREADLNREESEKTVKSETVIRGSAVPAKS